MRVFKKRENPLVFKGFLVKSHLKMKTCFYEVRHNPKSEQLGSGFVVCDSVSGPIGVTKKKRYLFFPIVFLRCSWSVRNDVVAGGFLLGSGYCRGNSWRLPEYILLLGECV